MGKYLKEFANHNGYTAYTADTENFILPNVSYCVQENEVHMMPYSEPINKATGTWYVESGSRPTELYNFGLSIYGDWPIDGDASNRQILGQYQFKEIIVDGVSHDINDLDANEGKLTLSAGLHDIEYVLKDDVDTLRAETFYFDERVGHVINGGLLNFYVPKQINYMEDTFCNLQTLSSITFSSEFEGFTNRDIGFNVMSIGNALKEVVFEDNSKIEVLPRRVFAGQAISSITFGENSVLRVVGDEAFWECNRLTSVTFPNSVQTFGDECMYTCEDLTSITMGSNVTSIGSSAFYNNKLQSFTINTVVPPSIGTYAFNPDPDDYDGEVRDLKIYVPSGSVNAYKTASGWSEYASQIYPIQ